MNSLLHSRRGFTLVELLVALAISGIIAAALLQIFLSDTKSFRIQTQVVDMQQTLRAGLNLFCEELRMAGDDPLGTAGSELVDIRSRDLNNNLDPAGNSAITFSIDNDRNGTIDDPGEIISYSIYDFPVDTPDGRTDLGRAAGAGRQLLAENIDALGLAYAFDLNRDNDFDSSPAGNLIWAVDTDNDNFLDTALDTNDDGVIDTNDAAEGTLLPTLVGLDSIRAVKIWMLVRSAQPDQQYNNTNTYVVANRRIVPGDSFRRRVLTTTVTFRNLGL
jgi:type IV pilus assembly protein PilW